MILPPTNIAVLLSTVSSSSPLLWGFSKIQGKLPDFFSGLLHLLSCFLHLLALLSNLVGKLLNLLTSCLVPV